MLPVLLIPIYEPQVMTVQFIRQLRRTVSHTIVIVDDGSGPEYTRRFEAIQKIDSGIIILSYAENRGKGAALKWGFEYILEHFPEATGVVTADGDGQHSARDILRMLEAMTELSHQQILLGVRTFQIKETPFKSYWGNRFTSFFYFLASGIKLADTQTGLRGFTISQLPALCNIAGDRFEYEMNVLLNLSVLEVTLTELPIETIYENNNAHSHFRPLKDSYLVYKPLVAFLVSSLASSCVDVLLFVLLAFLLGNGNQTILLATGIARILSGVFNYQLNKHWVFQDTAKAQKSFWKYGLLFSCQLLLSWLGVSLLQNLLSSLVLAKLITDCLLFLGSFAIQKRVVFNQIEKEPIG